MTAWLWLSSVPSPSAREDVDHSVKVRNPHANPNCTAEDLGGWLSNEELATCKVNQGGGVRSRVDWEHNPQAAGSNRPILIKSGHPHGHPGEFLLSPHLLITASCTVGQPIGKVSTSDQ